MQKIMVRWRLIKNTIKHFSHVNFVKCADLAALHKQKSERSSNQSEFDNYVIKKIRNMIFKSLNKNDK